MCFASLVAIGVIPAASLASKGKVHLSCLGLLRPAVQKFQIVLTFLFLELEVELRGEFQARSAETLKNGMTFCLTPSKVGDRSPQSSIDDHNSSILLHDSVAVSYSIISI